MFWGANVVASALKSCIISISENIFFNFFAPENKKKPSSNQSQSIVYCSIGDTILRDFYIMTLAQTIRSDVNNKVPNSLESIIIGLLLMVICATAAVSMGFTERYFQLWSKRSVFQIFWKVHCCPDFLFLKLRIPNLHHGSHFDQEF